MTVKELEDRWLAHFNLDVNATSSATTRVRGRQYINDWHRQILAKQGFGRLRHSVVTFATVASQSLYTLVEGGFRIVKITERTNDHSLIRKSLDWYRVNCPDPAAISGTPDFWIPMGETQVAVQPAAATGVWAVSSSASDTNTVYVEGIRSSGAPASLSATMTGASRKALSASVTDLTEITKFYVSAAAVGDIDLYDAATNGNKLATIPIGRTYARYQQIALFPTPSAVVTHYVDVERDLEDMANPNDEPLLPPDYHWVLLQGAKTNEYERTADDRWSKSFQMTQQGIAACLNYITNDPDYIVVPGGNRVDRSNLGPMYPPGIW